MAQPPANPQLQAWVQSRWENTVNGNVRLEASYYGPLLNVAGDIFPSRRMFMIKPQGALRDEHDCEAASDESDNGSAAEDDVEEHVGDISIDSNGGRVTSREKGRVPAGKLGYADFLIAKATEGLKNDTIIAIVEIKIEEDNMRAKLQMMRYLRQAASKQHSPNLRGYLVLGEKVTVYQLQGTAAEPVPRRVTTYSSTSARFYKSLHAIAVQHWE